jgi:membrane protein implicated in regulation of membrane protease activity
VSSTPHRHSAPPANKGLLAVAGVLLAIPLVALTLVGTYAKDEPRVAGFPFFIWYQFVWVVITSALTYTAHRLVLKARPHRPMNPEGDEYLDDDTTTGGGLR